MFVCEAMQLLPGEPCEDFAYRFKKLGCACASVEDKDAAVSALQHEIETHARSMHPSVACWLASRNNLGLRPLDSLFVNGWSGWEPDTGLGFHLSVRSEQPPAPSKHWDWDTDALLARRDAYLLAGAAV